MFATPLQIQHLGGTGTPQYRLLKPLIYEYRFNGGGLSIVVPEGFVTDFASIPRIFWAILPHDGAYAPAAVVHDYLYSLRFKGCSRFLADSIFRDAMARLNVPIWRRVPMYYAVRAFGWLCASKEPVEKHA